MMTLSAQGGGISVARGWSKMLKILLAVVSYQVCFLGIILNVYPTGFAPLFEALSGNRAIDDVGYLPDPVRPTNETIGATVRGARIWMCPGARNEAIHALEWLEHYRYMGVERVVLFDDGSSDGTKYLSALYEQRGVPDFLSVVPIASVTEEQRLNETTVEMDSRKNANYRKCADLARSEGVEWVIVCDIDEFIYPSGGPEIAAKPFALARALQQIPSKVDRLIVSLRNFGPSSMETRVSRDTWGGTTIDCPCSVEDCKALEYAGSSVHHAPNGGSLALLRGESTSSAPERNNMGETLLALRCRLRVLGSKKTVKQHMRRAVQKSEINDPTKKKKKKLFLGNCEKNQTLFEMTFTPEEQKNMRDFSYVKSFTNITATTTKSIYRINRTHPQAKRCRRYNAHHCSEWEIWHCLKYRGDSCERETTVKIRKIIAWNSTMAGLTGNHYVLRSFDETARKALQTHRAQPVLCFNSAAQHWTKVRDTELYDASHDYLSKAMERFK